MKGKVKGSKDAGHEPDQPLGDGGTLETLVELDTTLKSHSAQFDRVLQAVLDTRTSLEARINAIGIEVNLRRVDHHNLPERVEGTENLFATFRHMVQDLQAQMTQVARPHRVLGLAKLCFPGAYNAGIRFTHSLHRPSRGQGAVGPVP
ncbi:hypothetical protein NDU88_009970 [Pleurodeles waltl]|uniref:Uncharacterized protein n=1 Tax=Pleurodeles waltl TaxID=8319 RepID=A0AAV7S0I6_PLEWA|nr:hypothetical protein NDU88_009970 [Pleurodeles waltl]